MKRNYLVSVLLVAVVAGYAWMVFQHLEDLAAPTPTRTVYTGPSVGGTSSSSSSSGVSMAPMRVPARSRAASYSYAMPAEQHTWGGNASSSSWQLYTVSSQTVQHLGGGGGGGAVSGGSSTSTGSKGITTSSSVYTFSVTPLPLAARSVQGGMTAEQSLRAISPRRVVINDGSGDDDYGDENLRPGSDPKDPYMTPVGEMPWWWLFGLGLVYVGLLVLRKRKLYKK